PTPSGAAQNAFAFKRGANYRHHKKPVNTQTLLYFQTRKTTLANLHYKSPLPATIRRMEQRRQ
ncbi:hypothetical protein, partial [Denitromonas ohlonensis]|uniref:hypothetical protein n=1 Tax=Denitromonas ohlonensis TaxID=3078508 RepID=UPI001C915417